MTIETIEALEKRAEICVSCGHVSICYACTKNGLSPEEVLTAIREWKRCEKALRAQQEQPNEPLAVEELREMWQEHSAVYVTNIDCTPIFGGKVCVAAVLDTVAAFGSCGGMVLQAIYGRSLTLAEGDYGKTWLAFRRRPEQEE